MVGLQREQHRASELHSIPFEHAGFGSRRNAAKSAEVPSISQNNNATVTVQHISNATPVATVTFAGASSTNSLMLVNASASVANSTVFNANPVSITAGTLMDSDSLVTNAFDGTVRFTDPVGKNLPSRFYHARLQ